MFLLISAFALCIAVKVFAIQFLSDDSWEVQAEKSAVQKRAIEPTRGQIFSSDKFLLATTVSEFEIRWDSQVASFDNDKLWLYIDSACTELAAHSDKHDYTYFKKKFQNGVNTSNRYQAIDSKVDFLKMKKLKEAPFFNLGRFKSGLIFVENTKRKHPLGKLAHRTIGIDREFEKVGMERAYDKELSGETGYRLEERLAGNVWKPITDEYIQKPIEGADIISSIHSEIQDVATSSLEKMLHHHTCEWGVAIVMEVETGRIKAMANLKRTENSELGTASYEELLNQSILTRTEPGSTFKLPSLLAAIDEGLISISDSVNTGNGIKSFYGVAMKDSDWDKGGYGTISVQQAFEKSSNVGCALALQRAYKSNPQKYLDKLKSMGLYDKLSLSFTGEDPPIIKSTTKEKGWSGISLTQMAIGYEVQMSPLQTLSFYNTVANNGKMMKPAFIESLSRRGEIFKEVEPVILKKDFLKTSTVQQAQDMMEGVVLRGTAKKVLKNDKYTCAGKTGTAWAAVDGSYANKKYQASFCGYFPAEQPKYSCIVVLFNPTSGTYYGSALAAPVFKDIADFMFTKEFFSSETEPLETADIKLPISKDGHQYELAETFTELGINHQLGDRDSEWSYTETKEEEVLIKPKSANKNVMPKVTGMGLKDALYLLESKGMKVSFSGYGTVRKQSVKAGTTLKNNSSVYLEMSYSK